MSPAEGAPRDVTFTPRAAKDLRQLDPPVRRRVLAALDRLAVDDPSVDVKRVVGTDMLRLRVGDWRVLFRVVGAAGPILVGRILPRGRAYER